MRCLAVVHEAWEPHVGVVQMIRIAHDDLPVVRAADPVLRGQVVVELDDRLLLMLLPGAEPEVQRRVEVGGRSDDALRLRRGVDVVQDPEHVRVVGVDVAIGAREREHVARSDDRLAIFRRVPREDAGLRLRLDHRARPREVVRQPQLFVVEEEERLAAPVVQLRDDDRSALAEAELIQHDVVLRQIVDLVEEEVRVHPGAAVIVIRAAGEPVRADRVWNAICTAPWPPTSAPAPAVVTVTASTASGRGVTIANNPSVDLLKFSLLLTPSRLIATNESGSPLKFESRLTPAVLTPAGM